MEELEESIPAYPWDSHMLKWYNKVAVSQDKSIICRTLIIQANNMSYGASGNARNVMVELIGRSLGFSDCGDHDDDTG